MSDHELSCSENKELLIGIHKMITSLANFKRNSLKNLGILLGALVIATCIAYLLHWLHLK